MSRRATLPQPTSPLERAALFFIRAEGLPAPETQVRFIEGRRFAADFLWNEPAKVILECHGGTWTGGGHVRGKQFESDCEKANVAQLAGYVYLQATTDQVHSAAFIPWLRQALERAS